MVIAGKTHYTIAGKTPHFLYTTLLVCVNNRETLQVVHVHVSITAPVTIVEANFLDNDVAEEMPYCGEEGGQLIATLNATPNRQWVHNQVEEWSNQEYVQCY